jgi:hypothetical protein
VQGDPHRVPVRALLTGDGARRAAVGAGAADDPTRGCAGLGPGVASRLLAAAAAGDRSRPGPASAFVGLELIGEGRSNAQIARDLGLSVKTVQNYVSRVLARARRARRAR